MRPCSRHGRFIGFWNRRQGAKESMLFIRHSGSKVHLVRVRVSSTIAGDEGPEVANLDRGTVGAFQLAEEVICLWIEDIDRTVAKIPNEKIVGELTKAGRCDRKSPGRIEHPAGCHSVQ